MAPVSRILVAAFAMAILALPMAELGYVGAMPIHHPLLPKPDHAGFASVNGLKIWYGIYNPKGPDPVILLHGGLGSSVDWRNQIPALVGKHKVIVADSRGQGRSTRAGQPISYDLMMGDVLALMDHLKIKKAAFAGWSDGGIIALDIAIHHPDRISKLFTYGANFSPEGLIPDPSATAMSTLRIEMASLVDEHAETVRDVTEMWNEEPDFTPEQLGSIHIPTMIADGAHEEAIKPEHTRELAEMIPGAELAILPNVGHSGLLEDPADFNKLLVGFLDGTSRAPAENADLSSAQAAPTPSVSTRATETTTELAP
ncbi:Pimeloyl-ACP methyl ester carboxylesterase [Kaistia soli DSM 19436]|uniref:Pimeloyl-ACP methyl ester carboxylesterase n=1 Tax=Kaistia soli DSM 19436 TaxID=1122133 RepID=A0A1M5H2B0_9HYPH|nr:alpha/beta hydrolase [Kaistia soli]SHG10073.1 Pimeloyl-ACP methyl ester carboxylesterase [Kaistia soli DSM 19436]